MCALFIYFFIYLMALNQNIIRMHDIHKDSYTSNSAFLE